MTLAEMAFHKLTVSKTFTVLVQKMQAQQHVAGNIKMHAINLQQPLSAANQMGAAHVCS